MATEADEEKVRGVILQLFTCQPGEQISAIPGLFTDDAYLIRPSGNPLGQKEIIAGVHGVTFKLHELWSLDDIRFLGNGTACIVTAKIHQCFTWNGCESDDVANNTIALEKIGDDWKVVRWQRSTGCAPSAATPKQVFR